MLIAWIQRVIIFTVLAFCSLCAWALWPRHPLGSLACLMAPIFIAPTIEAVQFLLLRQVERHSGNMRQSWRALFNAWVGEVKMSALVFNWWQPFCKNAIADNTQPCDGKRGIVLVHGFFCNRGFWTRWMQRLQTEKAVFIALDLEPAFGSIDDYVHAIESAAQRVQAATGRSPVIIGHSMGGLAIRAWLASGLPWANSAEPAYKVVTIGTPHKGTWLARFSQLINGRQMQLNSSWIQSLEGKEQNRRPVEFICYFSDCDNIVYPVLCATKDGAQNTMVRSRGHVDMVNDAQLMDACWALMQ
jgi:triacylglycerol lipase